MYRLNFDFKTIYDKIIKHIDNFKFKQFNNSNVLQKYKDNFGKRKFWRKMKNLKKIIPILILVFILSGCTKTVNKLKIGETYSGETFAVTIKDSYEADILVPEGLKLDFDKYVAVDVEFENLTDKEALAQTMLNFELEDNNVKHDITIDENDKKFAQKIEPHETWDITLVFAVDNANSYQLYYSEGFKTEKEDKAIWEIDGNDLEKKKVKKTLEHNKPGAKKEVTRDKNE